MPTTKRKSAAKKPTPAKKRVSAEKPATAAKTAKKLGSREKAAPAKKTAATKQDAAPSPTDKAGWAPGILCKHDNNYSLIYVRFPDCEAFEERGLQGGGYTWHGLVAHVLREDAPAALKKLEFDPEGSMFSAVSTDLDALYAVARALKKLEDPALLTKLARTVDLIEYD